MEQQVTDSNPVSENQTSPQPVIDQPQESPTVPKKKSLFLPIMLAALLLLTVGGYFIVSAIKKETLNNALVAQTAPTKNGQDGVLSKLLSENFEKDLDNEIWVKAYSPWVKTQLPDFTLSLPDCQNSKGCKPFSSDNEIKKFKDYFYGKEQNCKNIGFGYFVSSYYEPVFQSVQKTPSTSQRNDIYLSGGLDICKVVAPTEVSAEEFVKFYNNNDPSLEPCKNKENGWTMSDGVSKTISLKNINVKAISFINDSCYPEEGAPGPMERYVVEFNKNVYIFDGGQGQFPSGVMVNIIESINSETI